MSVGELIRQARRRAGLSQEELARRAGTSQPTVANYEAGRIAPQLDTLGRLLEASEHELKLIALPKVRRGALPVAAVAEELQQVLREEGMSAAWRRLLDFVDDFRASSRAGRVWLVADEPPSVGDARLDAALAALVEYLCDEADVPWPGWTADDDRIVEPWWFVADLPGFEAMALRDSPIEFKRHGVFVTREAFERA